MSLIIGASFLLNDLIGGMSMMKKSAILPTQTLYPSMMLNNLNLQNHSPNQQKGKRSDNLTSTYDAESSSFAAPLFR